jgi:ACS family hexuronate transporter-like MFS transporter
MAGLSILSYLDRQVFAVLSPTILADTHLTTHAYTQIISGFSIAYMLVNPLWGSIMDRYGVRYVLLVAVLVWTLASSGHAFAYSFWSFFAFRLILGIGEGATFPGILRTILDSLPERDHGNGLAIGYGGVTLAALAAPLIFIPVAAQWGWRFAFLTTCLLGLTWALFWLFTGPRHSINTTRHSVKLILPNPLQASFWVVFSTYALGAVPWGTVFYLMPLYLRHLGLSQGQMAAYLWIPPLGGELGFFFWAYLVRRISVDIAKPYKLYWAAALFTLPYAAIPWVNSLCLVIAIFTLAFTSSTGLVRRRKACSEVLSLPNGRW